MANPTTSVSAGSVQQRATEQSQVVLAPQRPHISFPLFKIIVYGLLTLGALMFVMPFIWMLSTSLMTSSEIAQGKYITGNSLYGFNGINEAGWDRQLKEYLPPRTEIDFSGTAATLNYIAHPDGGVFDVSIDGQLLGSVDTYSETTENRSFLIDSYPEVPTLSLTQSVGLADSRHQISISFNEQSSQGDSLWISSVTSENTSGNLELLYSSDPNQFATINGVWKGFTFNTVTENWQAVHFVEDAERWEYIDGNTSFQYDPETESWTFVETGIINFNEGHIEFIEGIGPSPTVINRQRVWKLFNDGSYIFDIERPHWKLAPEDKYNVRTNNWEIFNVVPIKYVTQSERWRLVNGIPMRFDQVLNQVSNIGFPAYLENCCRALIARSPRLQDQPLAEFIRLERPSGTHSSFTTNFLPGFVIDLFGLSERYIVTGSFSHYVRVWTTESFSEFFINSVIITGLTVLIQTLFSILAAYAFARIEFPGRNVVFVIFLTTLFVPTMVVLVPNLLTVTAIDRWSFQNIGPILDDIGNFTGTIPLIGKPNAGQAKWLDNWPSLVLPFTASTFSIFLLRQFFMQIPNELWDAAQIDGAGHLLFLFRIVVPISRAALTTIVLFTFIGTWDALEWPILVTTRDDWRPISYALYNFRNEEGNYPQLLMAGALITLFPVIVVYLIAQKQFTEGIATTGLKG